MTKDIRKHINGLPVSEKAKLATELLNGLAPYGWCKKVGDILLKTKGKEPNPKKTQNNFQLIKSHSLDLIVARIEGEK